MHRGRLRADLSQSPNKQIFEILQHRLQVGQVNNVKLLVAIFNFVSGGRLLERDYLLGKTLLFDRALRNC